MVSLVDRNHQYFQCKFADEGDQGTDLIKELFKVVIKELEK